MPTPAELRDGRSFDTPVLQTLGGTTIALGGASAITAASSEVEDTTTETAFDQVRQIPANVLKVGSVVKIYCQGLILDNNSTDTFQWRLVVGGSTTDVLGTELITSTAVDVADSDIFGGYFVLTVRTIGSSGTWVGFGQYQDADAAAGTQQKMGYIGSTTVDTTAALPIKVTGEWSVAHADNEAQLDVLAVEIFTP